MGGGEKLTEHTTISDFASIIAKAPRSQKDAEAEAKSKAEAEDQVRKEADRFDVGGLWSSGPTPEQFQELNAKLFAKDRGLRNRGSIMNLLTENFKFEEEEANEFVQSWQELRSEQAILDVERRKIRELMDG